MSLISTVFIYNNSNEEDFFIFEKEILFTPAVNLIKRLLPEYTKEYFLDYYEKEISYEKLEGFNEIKDCEHIMLISELYPIISSETYFKLISNHVNNQYDISAFSYYEDTQKYLQGIVIIKKDVFKNLGKWNNNIESILIDSFSIGTVEISNCNNIKNNLDLYSATKQFQKQININHIKNNVNILDIESTFISADSLIGSGSTIYPNCIIKSSTIGHNVNIGINSHIENSEIDDNTTIKSSQIYSSKLGKCCNVGPFAYIRPDSEISDNVKIGDFVEIKKSKIGSNTKVSHLTYIGDSIVGRNVNFGCGTVTVNYDGFDKHTTEIGDNSFIGCNTNLVAPVKVGKDTIIAAGSTITKAIPDGALAIARSKQENKDGYSIKRRNIKLKKI